MTRFHVHIGVADLAQSIAFYSALFGVAPVRREADYAKWQLGEPRLNFAISAGGPPGIRHLGFEAETPEELQGLEARATAAGASVLIEKGAGCCYARSDKAWVNDPQGISFENFLTHEKLAAFGDAAAETYTVAGANASRDTLAAAGRSPGCCA